MSLSPSDILRQVQALTSDLIEASLCNQQNFPSLQNYPEGVVEVGIAGSKGLSIVLKNIPYKEVYHELDKEGLYNMKMVDGALVQIMYRFIGGELSSHRLAFFPCPDLAEFQNNPEIYEEDDIYAEVISRNIVSSPLRFDYDANNFEAVHHPKSHLTIGQYVNCRIPVAAPVTPYAFIDFILRSFYNTAHKKFCSGIRRFGARFENSLLPGEQDIIHIQPCC